MFGFNDLRKIATIHVFCINVINPTWQNFIINLFMFSVQIFVRKYAISSIGVLIFRTSWSSNKWSHIISVVLLKPENIHLRIKMLTKKIFITFLFIRALIHLIIIWRYWYDRIREQKGMFLYIKYKFVQSFINYKQHFKINPFHALFQLRCCYANMIMFC